VVHYGQGYCKHRGDFLTGNRGHPPEILGYRMLVLQRWAIGCIEKSALISRLEVN
jgi:hypothetical protein